MVENEEGLINYIIENEIKGILGEIENKSRWYAPGTSANGTGDINGTAQHPMEIRKGWMMVDNGWVIDEGAQGIKKEMDQIKEQIAERTFAPGTSGVGEPGKDMGNVIVEEGDGSGDEGLKPEVKIEVAEGDNGNNVVDKVVVEDGGSNVIDKPSRTKDNEDVSPEPNIVDDDIAPGPQGIVG